MSYTREEVWSAVAMYVEAMTLEELQELVSEDLFEFYWRGADEAELEEFMCEGCLGVGDGQSR